MKGVKLGAGDFLVRTDPIFFHRLGLAQEWTVSEEVRRVPGQGVTVLTDRMTHFGVSENGNMVAVTTHRVSLRS